MSQEQEPRVSDEAAMWLARMLRSDASSYQVEFETWLHADDAHGFAYQRLQQQYERSRVLTGSRLFARERGTPPRRRPFLPIGFGIGAVVAGLATAAVMLLSLSAVFTTLLQSGSRPTSAQIASAVPPAHGTYRLTSPTGDIRTVRLPDGSKVTLDAGATLTVAFGDRRRSLTLTEGRARFEVAHEIRPFVVEAGTGEITAHGTIFDVEIKAAGRVQVALLRGAIAVRVHDVKSNRIASRELIAHQRTDFDVSGFAVPIQATPFQANDWPRGVIDADTMPLAELLGQANRYTAIPFEIDDPSLASLQISGRFHINQPDLLAQNLADLFDLMVDRTRPDRIELRKIRAPTPGPPRESGENFRRSLRTHLPRGNL